MRVWFGSKSGRRGGPACPDPRRAEMAIILHEGTKPGESEIQQIVAAVQRDAELNLAGTPVLPLAFNFPPEKGHALAIVEAFVDQGRLSPGSVERAVTHELVLNGTRRLVVLVRMAAENASSVTFLDADLPQLGYLVITARAEAPELLESFLAKGPPVGLLAMDFGVGDLKCIGFPALHESGRQSSILISESHAPTKVTGPGVRECTACGIRWKSVYGELMDSGKLNKLNAQSNLSVVTSRDQILGLTCTNCRRSMCLKHLGRPLPTGGPAEGNVKCPSCAESLYWA